MLTISFSIVVNHDYHQQSQIPMFTIFLPVLFFNCDEQFQDLLIIETIVIGCGRCSFSGLYVETRLNVL